MHNDAKYSCRCVIKILNWYMWFKYERTMNNESEGQNR